MKDCEPELYMKDEHEIVIEEDNGDYKYIEGGVIG